MAKEIFQDVIPPGKRSIRRIPLKGQKVPPPPKPTREKERLVETPPKREVRREEPPVPFMKETHYSYEAKRRFPKGLLWGVVGIVVLALLVFLLTTFSASAKITITAREADTSLDSDFLAQQNPSKDAIAYQIIPVSEDAKEIVKASGTEDAKKKASGTVVLYNNFSTTPQKLIRNTRIATADGLIYRIDSSVTIPGKSTVAGKSVPGSATVLAYADSAGEEYNVGLVDFTIPGFKGTTKYKDFYGRSKTPMQGGLIGKINTITLQERSDAIKRLQTKAVAELISQANTQRQDGAVIFSNSYTTDFSNLPDRQAEGNSIEVGVHANLKAIAFDEAALGALIAEKTIKDFDQSPVVVLNMDSLAYEAKKADPKHPFDPGAIPFHLKGQPKIQWIFDSAKIKSDVAGKPRGDLQNILAAYHGIEKAEVVVKPFWLRSFPSDTSKIAIEQH
ncbi:MAG: hypothetical protein PHV93_00505 [Candidatus Pacebacteria bacterium]|nr:hypothetical protein [Candidatus Paceibacterota bacterium]